MVEEATKMNIAQILEMKLKELGSMKGVERWCGASYDTVWSWYHGGKMSRFYKRYIVEKFENEMKQVGSVLSYR